MAREGRHRKALVSAAARLFRRQGYAGTGLADILAASGAPRGSLYHYFPGGKQAIGAAAVGMAGRLVSDTLRSLAEEADGPADFVARYCRLLVRWMEASGFRDGCPITTTLLETAPDIESITAAGRDAFADWQDIVAGLLRRHGWPDQEVEGTATAVIAALEGALLMARVEASPRAIEATSATLARLLSGPESRPDP